MKSLRRLRWLILATILLLGSSILYLAPHYMDAQMARDADAFRAAVADDGANRVAAAAVLDVAFAASYALLGASFGRISQAAKVGAGLIGVAAVADIVENAIVLFAISEGERLDGRIVGVMQGFGAVKYAGILLGFVLICVGLVCSRLVYDPRR